MTDTASNRTIPKVVKSEWGTPVLSRHDAQEKSKNWLDAKKVKPGKRENFEDNIEDMIDGFQTGQLVLNDDNTIELHLIFPKETDAVTIKSLMFKSRITPADKRPYMKKVKPGDVRANLVAIACALTGQGTGIIESLDTEDFELVSTIALFFI